MFVYNPLGAHSELFKLYAPTRGLPPPEAAAEDAALLALYARLTGHAEPLNSDARALAQRTRAFLPLLLDRSGLIDEVKRIPIVFPASPKLDARSVQSRQTSGVFITSGTLDAIELFARTVSTSARLNHMVLPDLAAIEDSPPHHIALAWMTVRGDRLPGMLTSDLLRRLETNGDVDVESVLFEMSDWLAAHLQPSHARYLLAHYLMQLTMRTLRRATLAGWEPAFNPVGSPPEITEPIDTRYLEVLTLANVVLHEIGHIVLGHNKLDYRGTDFEIALAERAAEAAAARASNDIEGFVDLVGSQASFELAADVFGVEVLDEPLREPLLETASLWCAAKERAHLVTGDRVADLIQMSKGPELHPSHALRVWYLNGRLSDGRRAGPIAQAIASAAETAGLELDDVDAEPAHELALFARLWDLVPRALDPGWAPATRERSRPGRARSREQEALELGLHAWEAGELHKAEQLFRAAARGNDPGVTAQAHGLIGRMREDLGDPDGALAEYQRGDELGDANAANDLATFLQDRGEIDAAIAAFERGDERGNAPSAFNLGLIANERGERDTAMTYFRRADQRGHAQAALNLGVLSYHAGELDISEAALRRAELRAADNAATYLGVVLRDRGDLRSAEAAWRRGVERGEVDALRNLMQLQPELEAEQSRHTQPTTTPEARRLFNSGVELHERGDEEGAQAAWAEADGLGDALAATNLGSTLEATGDLDAAMAAYQRADARGDNLGRVRLGRLLEERGELVEAEAAYSRADANGDAHAAAALGRMLADRGDLEAAEAAWRRGDQRGNADAALQLGVLLRRQGKLDAGEAAVRRAIERGHPSAMRHLAFLLAEAGYQKDAAAALMMRVGENVRIEA